jgi:hypothetical protein
MRMVARRSRRAGTALLVLPKGFGDAAFRDAGHAELVMNRAASCPDRGRS